MLLLVSSALAYELAGYSWPADAFPIEPNVLIDNKASNRFTVIEINARDRPALLYQFAFALFQSKVTIHSAHVATYGELAVDTFYLTDLITRQFEAFVIEPLKLDKHPELRDMVFGNYTKIVYLAQTEDEALQKKAKWAADYLKLDYEYRFTGYGDLTSAIVNA